MKNKIPTITKTAKRLGYRSGLELSVGNQLDKAGVVYGFESNACVFDWFSVVRDAGIMGSDNLIVDPPEGSKIVQWHKYTVDFVFVSKGGEPIYIETKGYFTSADRTKHKQVQLYNPNADIRMVFSSDGWVTSRKLLKYSGWCKNNGIPYHIVGHKDKKNGIIVPVEWLEE